MIYQILPFLLATGVLLLAGGRRAILAAVVSAALAALAGGATWHALSEPGVFAHVARALHDAQAPALALFHSQPVLPSVRTLALVAANASGILALGVYLAFRLRRPGERHIRGGKQADASAPLLPTDQVILGRVPWPRPAESQHLLALGGTGVGKSQVIRAVGRVARHRGDLALVLDIGAELMTRLYDPARGDVILAAHDTRCASWSPLAELMRDGVPSEASVARIAAALVPAAEGGDAQEWTDYARAMVEAILIACCRLYLRGGRPTNRDLVRWLVEFDPDNLRELVPEHPVHGMLGPGSEKMAASARGVAATKARALGSLPPQAGFDDFSVSSYVHAQADGGAGWLFVPVPALTREAAFPLASLAAGVYVDAVLSLDEDPARRCFLLADELGQYPKINALARALTLGRKYGLSFAGAVQAISQLKDTYGNHGADTLLSCCTTRVIYRCVDHNTAEWAEREIGKAEIERAQHSKSSSSSGGGQWGNGSSSSSTTYVQSIQSVVLASEIQALPPYNAYVLGVVGIIKTPVAEVNLGPQRVPQIIEPAAAPTAPASAADWHRANDLVVSAAQHAQTVQVASDPVGIDLDALLPADDAQADAATEGSA